MNKPTKLASDGGLSIRLDAELVEKLTEIRDELEAKQREESSVRRLIAPDVQLIKLGDLARGMLRQALGLDARPKARRGGKKW
ncbi:hypothetical protein S922_14080 [Salmonella enterica subsp. enterica]|nr:hypothetical protein [Salmonella enterica subsp. enterica]EAW9773102.1 hypothetical protein [Salmonella enterica]